MGARPQRGEATARGCGPMIRCCTRGLWPSTSRRAKRPNSAAPGGRRMASGLSHVDGPWRAASHFPRGPAAHGNASSRPACALSHAQPTARHRQSPAGSQQQPTKRRQKPTKRRPRLIKRRQPPDATLHQPSALAAASRLTKCLVPACGFYHACASIADNAPSSTRKKLQDY